MKRPEFALPYSDNDKVSVAERLRAEIEDRHPDTIDIASGYLATSVWEAIGDSLSTVENVRLLIGKDWELAAQTTADEAADIADLVREALRNESEPPRLPTRDDAQTVAEFVQFLRRDKVHVKAWRGEGFLHAKAYILDHSAGVGSANFTGAGFQFNRELVMWRQDYGVVADLKQWFQDYWDSPQSTDYKDELLDALTRTRFGGQEYRPYDVLIRTLADRYGLERPPSLEQATFTLKWFQNDAAFRLIKMLSAHARGGLLADAVGMGKTYIALAVAYHLLHQQRQTVRGRPVLLIIPASLRRTWEDVLDKHNLAWAFDILHVQNLRDDTDVEPYTGAELVIIDEAHRLRGGRTWFTKVVEILGRSVERGGDPRVLLLTATPVNTGMRDLTNLLRVLTKNRRNVWAPEIPDFERYLARVERKELDPYPILDRAVVRRSRSDILAEYEERLLTDPYLEPVTLPKRRLGTIEYQYAKTEGNSAFDVFESTFPSMYLAPYDLERFRRNDELLPVDAAEVPASSLAGLYMTGLLKRFESSVRAITVSLRRLDRVLDLFGRALTADPPRLLSFAQSREMRRLLEDELADDTDDGAAEFDARFNELLPTVPALSDVDDYDLDAVMTSVASDRAAIAELVAVLPAEADDGKFDALLDLLTRKMSGAAIGLHGRRTLVFTQFRDTADYLKERLDNIPDLLSRVGRVELLHGGSTSAQRNKIARTFDPDVVDALDASQDPPRVLVSTDVLAEGHNLQLAQAVVNYDLHWNPQVAVQRSGRVDRLNSPHETVYLLSFLPHGELDRMLGLVDRLNMRFSLYKHLGLADEPVTQLTADQLPAKSFEQLRRLYRDEDDVLDEIEKTWTLGSTDYMRAPLEAFLRQYAQEGLKSIPAGVQSVKAAPEGWRHGTGVFIALSHGRGDSKESYWRFYPRFADGTWGPALRDDAEVFRAISCTPGQPRMELPADLVPEGPGGVIDWALLNQAAREISDELTSLRHTSAVVRGASERSARLRARLLAVLGDMQLSQVDEVLDRLEQVRVEDFDADRRWDAVLAKLREAERTDAPLDRRRFVLEFAARATDLFGPPVDEDDSASSTVVSADEMQLTSWEWILTAAPTGRSEEVEQLRLS